MNAPAIELKQVAVVASGKALLDIESLSIAHGERVAIIGPNGAGKSTLLRLLSGFVAPVCGTTSVGGLLVHKDMQAQELRALRCQVGQVMQGLHLVARVSAIDNVLIGCLGRVAGWRSWLRVHAPTDIASAQQALQSMGMVAKAHTRTDKLSGGERQKVAIARLLLQNPSVILADEPTAALDPAAAVEVCKLLVAAAHNATLITVIHNPALIHLIADRVIGLKEGKIAFDLPAASLTDLQLSNLYRAAPTAQVAHWQVNTGATSQTARTIS